MKHIIESIIGRKSSGVGYKLSNPKLKDLQHLDVVKCANSDIYICIDPDWLREQQIRIDDFDAYRINNDPSLPIITSLGLYNYHQNLTCNSSKEYDIVAVYRGIFANNEDYPDFRVIWNILQEKIKFIV